MVLDIETLHAVKFASIRDGGSFKTWTHAAWATVWPAQVCAVRFDDGAESDRINTTIDWGAAAPPLNNPYCPQLTEEKIAAGMSPGSFFQSLKTLCSGVDAFVGYNVAFDMGALRHHAAAYGHHLPSGECVEDICLMRHAAKHLGRARWVKLTAAYESICGVPADLDQAHDAGYDVYMTICILDALTRGSP